MRTDALDATSGKAPSCITSWTESRYRPYGYDHVVHIKSTCDKPADCTVSTNVVPQPTKALVPAASKVEVLTFLSSPASAFTATVDCTLRQ
ncbi:MAG: hypothetical protein NVS3B20_20190 [Polyangiales bacterium]